MGWWVSEEEQCSEKDASKKILWLSPSVAPGCPITHKVPHQHDQGWIDIQVLGRQAFAQVLG